MIQNNFMKFVLCLALAISTNIYAQLNTPRGSQMATVSQRVGITDITITYSRPSVNGREIWGNLVPFGMNNLGFGTAQESPWRAGANENTTISFTDDVTIEGKSLKAGTYGLHMIVNENNSATVIFSHNSTAWGSFFYEPSEDALRVDVMTNETPFTEQLTFDFINVDATSATAVLNWEKKQIPFKIGVDVTNIVLADIRNKLQNQPGFQRQSWEQAANFALNNGGDLNEALGWIDNAIAGQFYSQKTFANLQIKSQILAKMGKTDEAVALMDEALPIATIFEVHQYGRTLIAQGKKEKALEVFKMNAEKNKNTWPVDVGLARGYSAVGDYNKALKHLKIALTRVPDAANKAAIETNLAKLEKGEDIN
jgi:predicted negative regulator of RcsB-dependent stress response